MEENDALHDTETLRPTPATDSATEAATDPATEAALEDRREQRELLLMRAGAHIIAVFADAVESVSDALRPAPLPHAPRSVLGIVSLRGRMRTVIDPRYLLANEPTDDNNRDAHTPDVSTPASPSILVALRGDEQLAIAVERIDSRIEIAPAVIKPHSQTASLIRGTLQHGDASVIILDPAYLFEAAMQGTDRRRQRS
jgi:chemotaxis signal transduction protein